MFPSFRSLVNAASFSPFFKNNRALIGSCRTLTVNHYKFRTLREQQTQSSELVHVRQNVRKDIYRWDNILENLKRMESSEPKDKVIYLALAIETMEMSGRPKEAMKILQKLKGLPDVEKYLNLKRKELIICHAIKNDWKGACAALKKSNPNGSLSMKHFNIFLVMRMLLTTFDETMKLFKEMKGEYNLSPSFENYTFLLCACVRHGSKETLRNLIEMAVGSNFCSREELYRIVLYECGVSGKGDLAFDLVQEIEGRGMEPCIAMWTNLIKSYGNSKRLPEALAMLEKMKKLGLHPDEVTFTCLINAASKSKDVEKAEEFFRLMKETPGLELNSFTYTALLSTYANSGMLSKAEKTFKEMEKNGLVPSKHAYTSLLRACVTSNQFERSLHWVKNMVNQNFQPDLLTWRTILDPAYKEGKHEIADKIYSLALRKGKGINPYRGYYETNSRLVIMDFHRYTVGMAMAALRYEFGSSEPRFRTRTVKILTGPGRVSLGYKCTIRNTVTSFLKSKKIGFKFSDHNEGIIMVHEQRPKKKNSPPNK